MPIWPEGSTLCPRLHAASRPEGHSPVGAPWQLPRFNPRPLGRDLIKRAHRDRHLAAGEPLRQLDDVDFLVGVFDGTREGSLRFCEPGKGLLAQSAPVPPLVQLPELLAASRSVAKNEAGTSQVKELLDAGSGSLGGARPKASVCDGDRLPLAKLSHPGDQWDVMAWEEAAWAMAHGPCRRHRNACSAACAHRPGKRAAAGEVRPRGVEAGRAPNRLSERHERPWGAGRRKGATMPSWPKPSWASQTTWRGS